ncbi:hypothetical protein Dimus_012184 [Dionaea muscipula]
MDSTQPGEADKSPKQTFSEESFSPESVDPLGDPLLHPRVGNQYQAEIPRELTKSELLKYLNNPVEPNTSIPDVCHSLLIGQPIPITWVHSEAKTIKAEAVELQDDPHSKVYISAPLKSEDSTDSMVPVPGLSAELWSDFEVNCFLLGLYIFRKNLLQVARFVESKEVGQVVSFYYGKFYRSSRYDRWSVCTKMKRRKSIIGQRLFTGCRQQELLSRLLPGLSEESKHTLQQVSKAFSDGRITLDEYVSNLKSLVGLGALVDAVGIGNKQDLTTLVTESSSRGTHAPQDHHHHLKLSSSSSGKAFSSLSCGQILELLSGDNHRLTKAKSDDIFWAAVWPRLLARGWHCELPKESYLVFLIPGVEKFSRRKLRKREHYFDIVTDVLKKVASEPDLLVLEGEEENEISGISKKTTTNGEEKSDDDCPPHHHDHHLRHCYLQPRENLMFTVVDTSLVREDKPSLKRELRSLPPLRTARQSSSCVVVPSSLSKGSVVSSAGDSSADPSCFSHSNGISFDGKFKSRRMKTSSSDEPPMSLGAVMKRRRLTACSMSDTIKREPSCILSLPAVDGKAAAKAKRFRARIEEKYLKGISNPQSADEEPHRGRKKQLFDLNWPPEIPPGNDDERREDVQGKLSEQNATVCDGEEVVEQQQQQQDQDVVKEDDDRIRHGKRNRAMSTKALEALESCCFLDCKSRRKRSPRS